MSEGRQPAILPPQDSCVSLRLLPLSSDLSRFGQLVTCPLLLSSQIDKSSRLYLLTRLRKTIVCLSVAQIPGTEGRCGMAAIEDRDGSVYQSALDTLSEGLKRSVPPYARPLFLRVMREYGSTYKVTKNVLQKESYNITKIRADPLYFLDPKFGRYVPLTESIFNDLNEGRVRI